MKKRLSEEPLYTVSLVRPIRFDVGGFFRENHGHRHINRGPIANSEVFLVEEGTLYIEADGRQTAASRGTVLVHPKGTVQKGYRTSTGPTRYVWFHFDAAMERSADERIADELRTTLAQPRHIYGEGTPDVRMLVVPAVMQPRRWAALQNLGYVLCENRVCFRREKDGLVASFLSALSADFLYYKESGPTSSSASLVDRVKEYIDHHIDNPLQVSQLTIEQIAENHQLNPDYLNRLFKKETGLSMHAYVQERRMVQACGLLARGYRVAVVARGTGFGNAGYFAQAFKRSIGCTPMQYRTRVRSV